VLLWDTTTGKLLRALGDDAGGHVAFSPNGRILAAASATGAVNLWDPATGTLLRALSGPKPAGALAFGPDGHRLATAATDNSIRVYDVTGLAE